MVSLTAVAESSAINLYKNPDNNSAIIQQLPAGVQVKVIASNQHAGFILVETDNGTQGWVATEEVKKPEDTTTQNNASSNDIQNTVDSVKSHGNSAVKYLISKSPDVIKTSQAYVDKLGDNYKRYLVDGTIHQGIFILGAVIFAIGMMLGLFIGRLVWRKKHTSYIR